jgi:hypothetical protein
VSQLTKVDVGDGLLDQTEVEGKQLPLPLP